MGSGAAARVRPSQKDESSPLLAEPSRRPERDESSARPLSPAAALGAASWEEMIGKSDADYFPPATAAIFREDCQRIYVRTDRLFAGLMLFQWLAAIAAACWVSPLTWAMPSARAWWSKTAPARAATSEPMWWLRARRMAIRW